MNRLLERNLNWLAKHNISVSQNRDDLEQLYEFMLQRPPVDVFAEIGVWQGGTLLLFSQFVKADGLILGIDKYDSAKRNDRRNRQLAEIVIKKISLRCPNVRLVVDKSDAAVPAVRAILGGQKIAHLHIDGDHTYGGAQADFENYLPLMQPRGIVQFHDIWTSNMVLGQQPTPADTRGYVRQYWQHLKATYPNMLEFANQTNNPSVTGIGIIQL